MSRASLEQAYRHGSAMLLDPGVLPVSQAQTWQHFPLGQGIVTDG